MKLLSILAVLAALLASAGGSRAQEVKLLHAFGGHKGQVHGVVLSPDSKLLATVGDDLRLWDAVTGKVIGVRESHHSELISVAFSPDGKRLAAAGDKAVAVWEVPTVKVVATITTKGGSFYRLAFSPDGKTLAAAADRLVKLWDVDTGRERGSFQRLVSARGQACSPDFKTLAAGNYQEIELWDVEKGKQRLLLSEHRGSVCCLAFSADGKTLVSASHRSLDDNQSYAGEVKLWDLATGREQATLKAKIGSVAGLALSADGKTLALLDQKHLNGDATLRVFDLVSGRERLTRQFKARSFRSVNFRSVTFRAGKLFVLEAEGPTARLWQAVLPKDGPGS